MEQDKAKKKKIIITRPVLLGLLIGLGILAISILLWFNPEIVEEIRGIITFQGWGKEPCENVSAPKCGGICPEGELCVPLSESGLCYCIEEVEDSGCSDSYPKCDGSCPEGYECKTKDNMFDPRCYCEKVECAFSMKPDCKGYCEEGSCEYLEEQDRCMCKVEEPVEEEKEEEEVTPCTDTYPGCTGYCDLGYSCSSTGDACECVSITNSYCANSYPDCTGWCGEGYGCVLDTRNDECECVVRSNPDPSGEACGDSEWPYCHGNCPEGMTCMDNEETAECVEDIFCYCGYE